MLRLPRKMTMKVSKVQNGSRLLKTTQKYCACHTERLLTRYGTCWNVTKCHACHSTRGYATFETSKATAFATLPIGTAIIATSSRTVANGCRRLPTVANTKAVSSDHLSTPRPPKYNRQAFATHLGKTSTTTTATMKHDKHVP